MEGEFRELVLELDSDLAKILVNIETLADIQKELANIWQNNNKINSNKIYTRVLEDTIRLKLLDELLYYTIKDLAEHHKQMSHIVQQLNKQMIQSS